MRDGGVTGQGVELQSVEPASLTRGQCAALRPRLP
jgi:hypothetical protein